MQSAIYSQDVGPYKVSTVVSGRWRENGYILTHRDTRASVIVDPGGRADVFADLLRDNHANLVGIALTHGHFDHVGAALELNQMFEQPCWLESRDAKLAKQCTLFALRFEGSKILPPPVSLFDAPRALTFGERPEALELEVLYTPGHTPGSVCFLSGGVAFVGDLLFRESVGPTVYPNSDRAALIASIDALLKTAPGTTILFAGHGRPWTVAEAQAWWALHADNPPAMKLFGEPGDKPVPAASSS